MGYRRYHESLSGGWGGGGIKDTMGLFQGVVGLEKIPWVFFRGCEEGGGGGATKDTMHLPMRGCGIYNGSHWCQDRGVGLSQDTAVSIHFGGSRACIIVLTSSLNVAIENAANKRSGLTLSVF